MRLPARGPAQEPAGGFFFCPGARIPPRPENGAQSRTEPRSGQGNAHGNRKQPGAGAGIAMSPGAPRRAAKILPIHIHRPAPKRGTGRDSGRERTGNGSRGRATHTAGTGTRSGICARATQTADPRMAKSSLIGTSSNSGSGKFPYIGFPSNSAYIAIRSKSAYIGFWSNSGQSKTAPEPGAVCQSVFD